MARKREDDGQLPITAAIDRRIVTGFLGDLEALLAELEQAGFSRDVVRARARTLGLTRDFIAQCRTGGFEVTLRLCLVCDAQMVSLGAQNRICQSCRKKR